MDNSQQAIQDRKNSAERDMTKFRALSEVFALCDQTLVNHRAQLVTAPQPPTKSSLEGLDAALEELRRLQKQTHEFMLKNEGALNALVSLGELFPPPPVATTRLKTVGNPIPAPPVLPVSSGPDEAPSILDVFSPEEEIAKEPIKEPRRRASAKSE